MAGEHAWNIGQVVSARYRLERSVAAGGSSETYFVTDLLRGDHALLKRLRSTLHVASFEAERAVLASVYSPYLPRLRDVGTDGPQGGYHVMTWVAGVPVAMADVEDPAAVMADVAEALLALHEVGLRHGDLSHSNVLVTEQNRGALIDLGGAVPLQAATTLGTPGYIAPEVVAGGNVDARADLFALGCVFERFDSLRSIVAELKAPLATRIPSARALLERLGRAAPVAAAGAARTLVGRERELRQAQHTLDHFSEHSYAPALVFVGARGVGKTRMLHELKLYAQRRQLSTAELPKLERGWEILAYATEAPGGRHVEDWQQACEGPNPVVVFADDVSPERLTRYLRATPDRSSVLLLATTESAPDGPADVLRLAPLSPEELRRWDTSLTPSDAARLHRATSGYPADVETALAQQATGLRASSDGDGFDLPDHFPYREELALLCAAPRRFPEATLVALERMGIARVHDGVARLRRRADAERIAALLPKLARDAHRGAADGAQGAERAFHLYRAGCVAEAEAYARDADFDADPEGWRRAVDPYGSTELKARALRIAGRNEQSLALLASLGDEPRPCQERALALINLGRTAEAHEEALKSQHPATIARAAFRLGHFERALEVARAGFETCSGASERAELHENAGAALVYLDRREEAEEALNAADEAFEGGVRTQVRRDLYRGIAASRASDPRAASLAYARALKGTEDADLVDLRATSVMNLATAHQLLGDWGAALQGYERALRLSRALGSRTTSAMLRYNLANLHLACGDEARASTWLDDPGEADGALGAALRIAWGERSELLGEPSKSAEAYEEAAAFAETKGAERERIEARQKLGTPCVEASLTHGAKDLQARSWSLRAALEEPRAAIETLRRAFDTAASTGDLALAAEIATRASTTLRAKGARAAAEAYRREAASAWETIMLSLSTEDASRFWQHPLRRSLGADEGAGSSDDAAGLRRILEINKKLNSSLKTPRLLEHALDAAIELSRAERGFVLIGGASVRVATARNMDRDRLRQPAMRFSRSIAEAVLESSQPVLTTNARQDPRFGETRSVHAMGLQSVACVPIESPRGVLGALYVDHRFLPGHFDERSLELLLALADQVALALDASQLRGELEAKALRLEREAAEKAALLEEREAALSASRSQLSRLTGAQDVRTDYAPLIGRSREMSQVFGLLDRLKGSRVPVLIVGESGTGKELIARALHAGSGPFAAINCAAMPASLLESQLFGHKRGAFTGATENREGLFVAAGEGTVFLDELGELPLTMQAKLLRALQEREVRPVGADGVVPFKARVIAATNRNLRTDAAEGRFREDLYYRLAVVTMSVPPLRERLDDLPLLVESLLVQAAQEHEGTTKELHATAMRALLAHKWPGNVRELANVLRRAHLLADGACIRASDLALDPSDEALPTSRQGFEESKARHIQEVLAESGWNVSEAARRLSMPRNTLYRHMRKFGLRK
ncbi:MAG: sigma 54-interacting transcriptional regulator [Polyangiales bacterium]